MSMPMLTDEQRSALSAAGGPVTVCDPMTQANYVLMPVALFQRCQPLLNDEPFDIKEAYAGMDAVAASEGWLDPEMDAYDRLDPRKP